jgi:hypothetical protein
MIVESRPMTVADIIAWLQTQSPDAEVGRHMIATQTPLEDGGFRLEFNYRMPEKGPAEFYRADGTYR